MSAVARSSVTWFAALLACLALAPALAQAGVIARGPAPDGARLLGPLCRQDSANFRAWWSEAAGAPGAIAGEDGSCVTPPQTVRRLLAAAEAARRQAIALGFPAAIGDAPPPVLRDARFTRRLLRDTPATRVAALAALQSTDRGRYLAGLTARQRTALLRGLPSATRRALLREYRRAITGRPGDFVGGDRRIDLVLDASATGVSGQVSQYRPGSTTCRSRRDGTRQRFVASWMTLLVGDNPAYSRSTLAHELMHVVQCVMELQIGTPSLVKEGTAEWFSAQADPLAFPGSPTPDGGVNAGNARTVSFCNRFNPLEDGLQPYASWAVWDALSAAEGPGRVRAALNAYRRPMAGTGEAAIAVVGQARWAAAVRDAARALCINRRSPDGRIGFAAQVRDFLGALGERATPGVPVTVVVPAGGVVSVAALWPAQATGAVAVRILAPGLAPATLAAHVGGSLAGSPLAGVAGQSEAWLPIPASAIGEGFLPVTIVNPSASMPLTATVAVIGAG